MEPSIVRVCNILGKLSRPNHRQPFRLIFFVVPLVAFRRDRVASTTSGMRLPQTVFRLAGVVLSSELRRMHQDNRCPFARAGCSSFGAPDFWCARRNGLWSCCRGQAYSRAGAGLSLSCQRDPSLMLIGGMGGAAGRGSFWHVVCNAIVAGPFVFRHVTGTKDGVP